MNNNQECENCKYFIHLSVLRGEGECRLNPPKGGEGFARVSCYDWCGQFKKREPKR